MRTHSSVQGPVYECDALSLGPFEDEPMQMWRLVEYRADGSERPGDEIVACSTAWMLAALDAAGVELGEFDRVVAAVLAEEGWSLVQVVAGWVARANGGIES